MKTIQAQRIPIIQGDDMKPTNIEQLVHADEIYALIAKALIRAGA
jgi:hypothetical protein